MYNKHFHAAVEMLVISPWNPASDMSCKKFKKDIKIRLDNVIEQFLVSLIRKQFTREKK